MKKIHSPKKHGKKLNLSFLPGLGNQPAVVQRRLVGRPPPVAPRLHAAAGKDRVHQQVPAQVRTGAASAAAAAAPAAAEAGTAAATFSSKTKAEQSFWRDVEIVFRPALCSVAARPAATLAMCDLPADAGASHSGWETRSYAQGTTRTSGEETSGDTTSGASQWREREGNSICKYVHLSFKLLC